MALTSPEFGEANAAAVAKLYAKKFGEVPDILRTQTGDGAEVI